MAGRLLLRIRLSSDWLTDILRMRILYVDERLRSLRSGNLYTCPDTEISLVSDAVPQLSLKATKLAFLYGRGNNNILSKEEFSTYTELIDYAHRLVETLKDWSAHERWGFECKKEERSDGKRGFDFLISITSHSDEPPVIPEASKGFSDIFAPEDT